MRFPTIAAGRRSRLPACLAAVLPLILSNVLAGCAPTIRPSVLADPQADARKQKVETLNADLELLAAQAAAAPGEYQIGPEDLVEVTLYDIEDSTGEPRVVAARVSNSGYLTLPYVGKVKAAGFGPLELEEELRRHYLRYIHQPQITVFIKEYRSFRVSVVGNVKTPGVLELRGRKTLLEAVAMAGGLDPEAGRTLRLTRASGTEVQSVLIELDQLAATGDVRLNPTLLPGDVITVPKAGIFYVEGMVNKPGAYPLLTETTVTQALVTAGGVNFDLSNTPGTTLYRRLPDGQREAISVDIGAIKAGKKPDMLVSAEDVIVVPISGAKLMIERITGLFRVGISAATF